MAARGGVRTTGRRFPASRVPGPTVHLVTATTRGPPRNSCPQDAWPPSLRSGVAMRGRWGVQQKLSVLLMLPLVAVIVTGVPFTLGRIDDAVAASATVGIAQRAQQVAVLMQDLQEERLLTLTYLVSP